MFGYVLINKPELKFKEYDIYKSYYCGLCHTLKKRHGIVGQISLTYDMTFLTLLLTSLYEPDITEERHRCISHPLSKHLMVSSQYTDYVADMNIILAYYKSLDDWSAFIITSYENAEKDMGIKATKNRKIYNGMLKTYFYQFMGPKPPRRKKD